MTVRIGNDEYDSYEEYFAGRQVELLAELCQSMKPRLVKLPNDVWINPSRVGLVHADTERVVITLDNGNLLYLTKEFVKTNFNDLRDDIANLIMGVTQ